LDLVLAVAEEFAEEVADGVNEVAMLLGWGRGSGLRGGAGRSGSRGGRRACRLGVVAEGTGDLSVDFAGRGLWDFGRGSKAFAEGGREGMLCVRLCGWLSWLCGDTGAGGEHGVG